MIKVLLLYIISFTFFCLETTGSCSGGQPLDSSIASNKIYIYVAPAYHEIVGGRKYNPKKIIKAYYKSHKGSKLQLSPENLHKYIVDALVYDFKREFPMNTVIDIGKRVNYVYLDLQDDENLKDIIKYRVVKDKKGFAKSSEIAYNTKLKSFVTTAKVQYILAIQQVEFTSKSDIKPNFGFSAGSFGVSPGMNFSLMDQDPYMVVSYVLFDRFGNEALTGKQAFTMPDYNFSNIFRFTLGIVHQINLDIYNHVNLKTGKLK